MNKRKRRRGAAVERLERRELLTTVYWAGGSGAWDLSAAKVWHVGAIDGPLVAWSNSANYDAVFTDGGSIITTGASIQVNSIRFAGDGDRIAGARSVTLSRGLNDQSGVIAVDAGQTATISATIGGSAGLTLTGGGTLMLAAANGYSGTTTVNDGVLDITADQVARGWSTTARPLVVNAGGTVIADSPYAITSSGTTSPTVTVNTGGTLTTGDGDHVHLKNLTLAGGTLASGAADASYGSWQFDSAVATVSADSDVSAAHMAGKVTWSVGADVTVTVDGSFGGRSLGSAVVTKTGDGAMVLTGDNSSPVGAAAFRVTGGSLHLGDGGAIGGSTVYDSAVLVFDGTGTQTIGASIVGTGSVQVAGGTVALQAGSQYTGGTDVAGGTLVADNAGGSATGSGPVSVHDRGTLTGGGSIGGAVTVSTGGTLAASPGSLEIGQLILTGGSVMTVDLSTDGPIDVDTSATIAGGDVAVSGVPDGSEIVILKAASPVDGTFVSMPQSGTITSGGVGMTADYRGNSTNPGKVALTVAGPIATRLSLDVPDQTIPTGKSVTLTATVRSLAGGVPTGTVTFFEGDTPVGSATLNSAGVATAAVAFSSVGEHSLNAVYAGDNTYAASSAPTVITVKANATLGTVMVLGITSDAIFLYCPSGGTHSGLAVMRSSPGAAAARAGTLAGTSTVFADHGLSQGVPYTYQFVSLDDGATSNSITVTTMLPAPAYQGPAAEPAYPDGFDTFSPPVSLSATVGVTAPKVDEYTRTADPDSSIVVTAEGSPGGFLTYGQTTADDGVLSDAAIQTQDARASTVTLPAALPQDGMYLVWARNIDASGAVRYSIPMVVNRPDLWWVDGSQATPGNTVSLFGRNLTRGTTGGQPDRSWVYIKGNSNTYGQWIPVTAGSSDVNPYKVDFTVPADLPVGNYTVWVNNGRSGHYGWSNAVSLTVSPVLPPQTVVVTEPTEAAVRTALATAQAISDVYSTRIVNVVLPNGTITVTQPLAVSGNVHLVGSGSTVLKVPAGANLPDVIDLGQQGRAGVENLTIIADDGAIALTQLPGDGRRPGAIQVGSTGQVLNNVVVSVVNPGGRAGPDVNGSGAVTGMRITGCTFIGPGLWLVGGNDLVIDGCTFVGAGAADASISLFNVAGVSVTRCTTRNLSDDPTRLYDSAARLFWLGSMGTGVYLGDNTTVGLFPEPTISSGMNGGEQILTESNMTAYQTSPVSAAGSTVTLPATAGAPGVGWTITVGAGPGLGQTRVVTNAVTTDAGVVVTVDTPWNVAPTTASVVAIGTTADWFVAYGNHLSGDGVQSFEGNSSGIQVGGTNVVIAGNTVNNLTTGIALWANSKYGDIGSGQYSSFSYFDLVEDNTVSGTNYGLRLMTVSHAAVEPTALILGTIWRDNTVSDVHATPVSGDLPSGISLPESVVVPDGQVTTNVFEHNTVTAPIGITFTPGGNQAPAAAGPTVDTLVRGNTFRSDGTPARPAVLATVTENDFATFLGNTYAGFQTTMSTPAVVTGSQLLVPNRTLSVTVAPNATGAMSLLAYNLAASAPLLVSATSLPSWLTFGPTSTTDSQGGAVVPLTFNAAGLSTGVYSATLTLSLPGLESIVVTVSMNVAA